jgi:catechol 2,3-dioxygenase-like lactoylglutathione lyase family enzyme
LIATGGVHHLAIQVRDLASVERFYREALGLALVRRWPVIGGGGGDRSAWLDTGDGTFLALEVVAGGGDEDGEDAERPGLHLVALRIVAAERAEWEQRLARAGVEVYHHTPFTLYVRDPEGNRVGLSHYPDRQPGAGEAETG